MEIIYKKSKNNVTIQIPIPLLKFIAENKPDERYKVKHSQRFAEEIIYQLEHNLGDEAGTGFQNLLDEAIDEVYSNGSEYIYSLDDEE